MLLLRIHLDSFPGTGDGTFRAPVLVFGPVVLVGVVESHQGGALSFCGRGHDCDGAGCALAAGLGGDDGRADGDGGDNAGFGNGGHGSLVRRPFYGLLRSVFRHYRSLQRQRLSLFDFRRFPVKRDGRYRDIGLLLEGEGDRADLAALVLDGHLARAGPGLVVGGEGKLQFAAGQGLGSVEADPGGCRGFHFDGIIGVVLDIDREGAAFGGNLRRCTDGDGRFGFLLHLDGGREAFAAEADAAGHFGGRSGWRGRDGDGSFAFTGGGRDRQAGAADGSGPGVVRGHADGLRAAVLRERQAGRTDIQIRFRMASGHEGQQRHPRQKEREESFHTRQIWLKIAISNR